MTDYEKDQKANAWAETRGRWFVYSAPLAILAIYWVIYG